MHTDKQAYLIFRTGPELAFELAALPSPGPCRMESISFKELECTTDGLIVPEELTQPLSLLEVQFCKDAAIYTRTVMMMALAQQPHLPRCVQGMIFLANRGMNPQTAPWSRIIHAVYLDEALHALRRQNPSHPLVAVFATVLIETANELEQQAKHYYHIFESAPVAPGMREILLRVFCDWLFERLQHKTQKEITMILDFPDVRETVVGRELLEEGIEKGQRNAWLEVVHQLGAKRLGPIDPDLSRFIDQLDSKTLRRLVDVILDMPDWQAVKAWLDRR